MTWSGRTGPHRLRARHLRVSGAARRRRRAWSRPSCPAAQQRQGVAGGGADLRCVDDKGRTGAGGQGQRLVRQVQGADHGMVQQLHAGDVGANVMSGPPDPELVAAGGELTEKMRDLAVMRIAARLGALDDRGVVGDRAPLADAVADVSRRSGADLASGRARRRRAAGRRRSRRRCCPTPRWRRPGSTGTCGCRRGPGRNGPGWGRCRGCAQPGRGPQHLGVPVGDPLRRDSRADGSGGCVGGDDATAQPLRTHGRKHNSVTSRSPASASAS